jgi:hypothetical protein
MGATTLADTVGEIPLALELRLDAAGRLGWFWGTDRWAEGEFFRYRITGLQPAGPTGT